MGIISASNPHCHSWLSKPILKILSICRKIFLGKQLSQAVCSEYVFRLLHAPKFQVFSTKLNTMVKVVKLFTGVLWKSCSDEFYRKTFMRSLFLNNVLRLQAKETPYTCFPVSFTKYFRTLLLQNTFGRLLLLNTLFCSLRRPQP